MDAKSFKEKETLKMLDSFLTACRSTPTATIPNYASPPEVFLGRRTRMRLDALHLTVVSPIRNDKIADRFNIYHSAKPSFFDEGGSVHVRDFHHPSNQWTPGSPSGSVICSVRRGNHIVKRHIRHTRCHDTGVSGQSATKLQLDIPLDPFVSPEQPSFRYVNGCRYSAESGSKTFRWSA